MSDQHLSSSPRPLVVWLTGLSGAGKSTLAAGLHQRLSSHRPGGSFILDGDIVRTGLCSDLGFGERDRHENIRRVAEVAKLMCQAGLTVICALISPMRADREMARSIVGAANFREIHVATPLAVCEQRDPKGLYRRARSQALPQFTGISAPYEEPLAPALRLDTSSVSLEQALDQLELILVSSARPFSGEASH